MLVYDTRRVSLPYNIVEFIQGPPNTYMIGPIFKHIIDFVQLYVTNGFANIVLKSVNCVWLVGVTLTFDWSAVK